MYHQIVSHCFGDYLLSCTHPLDCTFHDTFASIAVQTSALLAINPSWVARKDTEGDGQQQQIGDAGRLNKLGDENEETMKDNMKQMQIEIGELREMVERMKSAQHEGDYEGGKPVTAQDDGPSNEGVNLATAQDEGPYVEGANLADESDNDANDDEFFFLSIPQSTSP